MSRRPLVDVDATSDAAFAVEEDYRPFASEWHAHEKHQLLYAARGTMTLLVDEGSFLLPPQRAAWIAAGTRHRAASATGVELRTVYFASNFVARTEGVRVFSVTPLAREMILHAMRWPPAKSAHDATREAFFRALGGLALEWMAAEQTLFLPVPRSDELARATRWVAENLAEATAEGAAKAAHVSLRTLSRRFEDEAKMPFRTYLQAARVLHAMELLAQPRAQVTQVAFAVGFQSVGAFSAAFHERTGETPRDYRARIAGIKARSTSAG